MKTEFFIFTKYKELTNQTKHLPQNSIHRKRYEILIAFMVEQKGCIFCHNTNTTLMFHHKNPESKVKAVSQLLTKKYSTETLITEIEKCYVVCRKCHRKVHSGQLTNDKPTIKLPENVKIKLFKLFDKP